MNNEDFCSYKIAAKLKELGFDLNCRAFYWTDDGTFKETTHDVFNNPYSNCITMVAAPTLAQAQKWLRQVHKLSVEPICNMVRQWNVNVCDIDKFVEILWAKIGLDTYESALSAGIEAALKLIEIDKTKKS